MHNSLPTNSSAADSVFGGLDWGEQHHQLCLLDGAGQVTHQRRYAHTADGLEHLERQLRRHVPLAGIAIERGEGLLVERLQAAGHTLYCVSPKISARARERYRMAPKTDDAFDAFVLADSLRHEHRHWRPLPAASPQLAELRAVIRDRERVIWNQRDLENQLRAILQAYHPAVLHLFSSLDRDISLAFLRDYPTPEQARRVGPERMKAFTGRHGYSGRTRPEVLVERLRTHLLSAAPGTVAGKELTAVLFAEQLALLNDHVRILNKRVDKLLATHPDAPIFLSFPCMGRSCAAMLLAEMGEDRDRFPTPAALLAETGVAPVTRASGRSRQVRFRYATNKRMRHAVDWWVFNMTREVPWVHEAYEQARAHKQPHHRAIRGLGARWVRILWRCWQDHTCYDPALHHSARPEASLTG
ncbi:IS110 family transposase [Streptomyces sp. NPDC001698]|uniref:IS110 family transposase n=1 Tax=Streptomyces sp. NPDC001698 TaxID=3364601 RepID=UPI003682EB58